MAKPIRIFSLNLGMQTICLSEFQQLENNGLCLIGIHTVGLISDPSADATRPVQIEAAVKGCREALKAPLNALVNVCLPSQSVFTRFVRLPGATADDVTSIIGFEAQQNVPFPIEEVVWDHQIMGHQRGETWDVVLVAMKADQLTEIIDAIGRGGLKARTIDVAPMALFNAFRYSYPEATGCSLVVDIGARTTNLLFIEGERAFSRSIPVGGSTISAAVAKEFGQDITLAERLKIERGLVGLGGAYAEAEDPMEARIAKVIRNSMTRLHAEVARSISYYRTSQSGSQPVRVYLCGGTVSLPYMPEFFTEKLQSPVEFFNPLKNIVVADENTAKELSNKAHTCGEGVGLALRFLGNTPLEINLRPPSVLREQDLTRRKPFLVLASVCLLLSLAAGWLFLRQATSVTEAVLATVQEDVTRLGGISGKMDALAASQKQLQIATAPLLLAVQDRSVWGQILDELGNRLPARYIWITELQPMIDGKVPGATKSTTPSQPSAPARPGQAPAAPPSITGFEIKGLYLANPPNDKEARIIDEFVESLKGSPLFNIGEDKTLIVTQRTTPDGESWAYGYTIALPLRTPIILP